MTIANVIALLREKFEPWIQEKGGTIVIAKDPWHAYEIISGGPRGLVLVLCYGGETPVDAPEGNPLARMRVEISIANGMGLSAETGAAQFSAVSGRASLADLVDGVIQTALAIDVAAVAKGTASPRFIFDGDEQVELPNGLRMAAYRVTMALVRLVTANPQAV